MYHWGEHGQNVVANSTLSFLPWGAFNKYMEIILPYLLLTYLNLDSFYYEGRQKLTFLGQPTHSFFLFNRSYSFLSFGKPKQYNLEAMPFTYSVGVAMTRIRFSRQTLLIENSVNVFFVIG